jgi:hypothetical protein
MRESEREKSETERDGNRAVVCVPRGVVNVCAPDDEIARLPIVTVDLLRLRRVLEHHSQRCLRRLPV